MGGSLPGSCQITFRVVALTKEGLQMWGLNLPRKHALVLFAFPSSTGSSPRTSSELGPGTA